MRRLWQASSEEAFNGVAQWREAHSKATLAQIEQVIDGQLPVFRPKCPLFDCSLKRPCLAFAQTRAETPGTHHVLWDGAVVSGRVPRPPVLPA